MARITIGTEPGQVRVIVGGGQARYDLALRVAPHAYRNTDGVIRTVGVGPVVVAGRIVSSGQPIAWCFGHAQSLPTPNKIPDPRVFATVLAESAHATVPVVCHGLANSSLRPHQIVVEWTARAALTGERVRQVRAFRGRELVTLDRAG